jgi:1-acyl-sn-glycerol-3-phosphate acyltransferase
VIRNLSRLVLKLWGWNTSASLPPDLRKAVIIVAPHTSYWDFVVGRLTFWAAGIKIRLLIKKESFFFPLGIVLRSAGAIPVDRGNKKNNMIDQVVSMFNSTDSFLLVIAPEGTRKQVRHWKRGFYMIAKAAGVPIALGWMDYRLKAGGVGPLLMPTGDFEKDMQVIREFYRGKTGRHPQNFYLPSSESKPDV